MKTLYRQICTLFGLLMATQFAFTQVIDLSLFDTKKDTIITGQVKVLLTDTIPSIKSLVANLYEHQFTEPKNDTFSFIGYDTVRYSFRFILRNTKDTTRPVILSLGPTGVKEAELFQVHNGNVFSLGKTGHKFPFGQRPYQYMHYAYPVSVSAHSTDTFYLQTDYHYEFITYGFALMKPHTFKTYENRVYFFFGIIIGLLLLFMVFNVFVFVSLKEKVHLWYALYIAALIMVVLKNDQLDDQFLGTDSEHGYRMFFLLGIGSLAIGILMHVVQLYLRNIEKHFWLYKVTRIVKLIVVFSSLLQLVVYYFTAPHGFMQFLFNWTDGSAAIGIIFIILNCVYSAFLGFRSAIFIVVGLCVFLTGAMQKFMLIPTRSLLFPPSIFHIGMVLEVIIISFGFIYSYRLERKQNRLLEINFKNELQKAQQEIQEQTLKTISQEIHDNIGQVLTLAKLTINTIDAENRAETKEKLGNSGLLLTKAIQDLRNLSRSMHADTIKEMGLIKALENEISLLKKTGTYDIELVQEGTISTLNEQYELILFRIFQEVVSNIIKHAKASKILVYIGYHRNHFELKITDNGVGFDLQSLAEKESVGMGLRSMQNRSKIIGAHFSISSKPGFGTTVRVYFAGARKPAGRRPREKTQQSNNNG